MIIIQWSTDDHLKYIRSLEVARMARARCLKECNIDVQEAWQLTLFFRYHGMKTLQTFLSSLFISHKEFILRHWHICHLYVCDQEKFESRVSHNLLLTRYTYFKFKTEISLLYMTKMCGFSNQIFLNEQFLANTSPSGSKSVFFALLLL